MSASFSNNRPKRKRNGYVMVFGTLMIALVLIPVMGLAIDVGLMYTVQSVMSAAADASAVAGARSLSRGSNSAQQLANAEATATAYFNANFPSGYLLSSNLQINSTAGQSQTAMRSVTTTVSVNLPLIFLNMLGLRPQTISASSTAQRRDVNVMIVMDRSGSLADSGSCTPLKAAAIGFVSNFAQGRDNVGLITFGSGSRVDAAPTTSFSPNVTNIINSINCTGATSSAQGLWQAYDQLVQLSQTGALNAIVFFTDGYPTAVTEKFPISSSSHCNPHGSGAYLTGVLTMTNQPYGLLVPNAPAEPVSQSQDLQALSGSGTSGCAFSQNPTSSFTSVASDLSNAPLTDIWGNSLTATGYKSTTTSGSGLAVTATNIQNFSTNAADDAGFRIRSGVADSAQGNKTLANVVIYTVGLNNAPGGIDQVLLQRIANDPTLSPNPVAAGAQGRFCNAASSSDLNECFIQVASQMLRISN
ncbi:MAG TPA: vWA domain-containing protein [Bryobacteraceae bacterium]|nr:vWA domain-containing protein [Bryobacteraceae bacterium]